MIQEGDGAFDMKGKISREKTISDFDYCGKRYGYAEKLTGFVIGGLFGFAVGQILYGLPVFNIILLILFGFCNSKIYVHHRIAKRRNEFAAQFCDYLDSIGSSLSCGKNTYEAFLSANEDMHELYRADSPICVESSRLSDGLRSGRPVSDLLFEMSKRSGNEDVQIFGDVYEVCSVAGGNLKKIVNDTRNIITEKITVEAQIQTALTEPKNELNIMAVMPLIITLALKMLGGSFIEGTSVFINTLALVVFVVAYAWGRKIVKINI